MGFIRTSGRLESEIDRCLKGSRAYAREISKVSKIDAEYVALSNVQNRFEGQLMALRKMLKELTK